MYWYRRWHHNRFKTKKEPTWEARELGERLRQYGWRVYYEKYDGYKHIDIAIIECKVDIEVDGGQHNYNLHQALSDIERTYWSFKNGGYITLRIPNVLVRTPWALDQTASTINKFLQESKNKIATPYEITVPIKGLPSR